MLIVTQSASKEFETKYLWEVLERNNSDNINVKY